MSTQTPSLSHCNEFLSPFLQPFSLPSVHHQHDSSIAFRLNLISQAWQTGVSDQSPAHFFSPVFHHCTHMPTPPGTRTMFFHISKTAQADTLAWNTIFSHPCLFQLRKSHSSFKAQTPHLREPSLLATEYIVPLRSMMAMISFPSLKSRGLVFIILAFLLLWPESGTQ